MGWIKASLNICSSCAAWSSCGSQTTRVGAIYPKSCCLYVGYVLLPGLPFLASVGENVPSLADLMCQAGQGGGGNGLWKGMVRSGQWVGYKVNN